MKLVLRIFLFLLASNLNITLKAEAKALEEPSDCWSQEGFCAVKSMGSRESLAIKSGKIEFSGNSLIARKSENKIRLIKGYFVVDSIKKMEVETKYATVFLEEGQSVIVNIQFDRVEFVAFAGDIVLKNLKGEEYKLPQSYFNWIGKIDKNNRVQAGFPRAANFKDVIVKVGSVTTLNKKDLYKKLEKFKLTWLQAIGETESRSIASSTKVIKDWHENQERLALSRKKRAKERKKMREFFFRKTFLE